MLDEPHRSTLPARFSVTKRRQLVGLPLALLLLPLVTLLLDGISDDLALDGQVLLYLLAFLMIAIHWGSFVAIG